MKKVSTQIAGLYLIEFSPNLDDRGFFVRNFDKDDFRKLNLTSEFIQTSLSFNKRNGTLRGLHLQKSPYEEVKFIQVLGGRVFDVIIDLRPDSKTFRKWQSFELDLHSQNALLVPGGCAHGFITLTDETLIQYRMDSGFEPSAQLGVRWNDPAFAIQWPMSPNIISERDESFPDWAP